MKNIFHNKAKIEMIIIASFLSLCAMWVCYDGANKNNDKSKNDFLNNSITSFCIGILSSALVVFFGVKSVKEHVDEIEQEDLKELHEFWKNNLAPRSRQTPRYNIIIVLEKSQSNQSQNVDIERLIGISKSFAYFHIYNTLNDIYDRNVEIILKVMHEGDKIDKNILEENLIFLGCGSTTNTIVTICKNLQIPYYQRDENNRLIISDNDRTTRYHSLLHADSSFVSKDFGIISRIANEKQLIIIYNANYSQGILGGVIATTNPIYLERSGFINCNDQSLYESDARNLIVSVVSKNNQIGPDDLSLDPIIRESFKRFELGSIKTRMSDLNRQINI